jgi:hypothetical protein
MTRRFPHRATRRLFAFSLGAAGIASLLGACSSVMDSYRIDPIISDAEPGVVCPSGLGSYALPKAFFHIAVTRTGSAAPEIKPITNTSPSVLVTRHPDRALLFCLDYLSSALSHDTIKVKKWPSALTSPLTQETVQAQKTAFLGAVLINAQDRTVFVVEALIRAAFIAASGDPNFAPRLGAESTVTLADLEYDPFDPRESAEVNARLSSLGICLVLDGYTFDRYRTSVDNYCNAPRRYQAWTTPILKAYAKAEATPADPLLPGLLYRPRIPYRLSIFRKPDPVGSGSWKLSETQQVALENLAPVLSLDVRRAAFAGRNANFLFNNGTLTTACVSKNSEIEGFVQIPLQISKSLVALPASILSIQLDQVNNQQALIKAENQLVQVQRAYLAALSSGTFTAPADIPTKPDKVPTPVDVGALPTDLQTAKDATAISNAPAYGADLFGVDRVSICGAN